MTDPTPDCPAWINAPDDATEQLFREIVAAYMESERRLRRTRHLGKCHKVASISQIATSTEKLNKKKGPYRAPFLCLIVSQNLFSL